MRCRRLMVKSFFFASFRIKGAQLSPQVEALNTFSGSFAISNSVFVPPDSFSGEMTPRTGLSTA